MKNMKTKSYKAIVISEENQRLIKQLAKRDGRSFAREAGVVLELGLQFMEGRSIEHVAEVMAWGEGEVAELVGKGETYANKSI